MLRPPLNFVVFKKFPCTPFITPAAHPTYKLHKPLFYPPQIFSTRITQNQATAVKCEYGWMDSIMRKEILHSNEVTEGFLLLFALLYKLFANFILLTENLGELLAQRALLLI